MGIRPKLFILGIDSASWILIDKWIKSKDLPNFKKVIDKGITSNLLSTTPPLTPVAWGSFYTGLNPGRHGIMDFYKLTKDKELRLYTAFDRQGKTFWEILDRAGYKCCVYNLPNTFPPKKLKRGIAFSGFTTPSLETNFITPRNVLDKFRKKFPAYYFNEKQRYEDHEKGRQTFFQSLVDLTKQNIKVSNWLFEKDKWDLFATNFMAVDHIQHWYWKFTDPSHPQYNKKEAAKHKDKILKIYQLIDEYLGTILEKLEKMNYNLMILSDHGAGPHIKNVYINNLLKKEKILKLKNTRGVILKRILNHLGITPHNIFRLSLKLGLGQKSESFSQKNSQRLIDKLIFTFKDIDWDRTEAYSFGYYGNIHFNKKIIDEKHEKQSLTARIIKILKGLKDPDTNKRIVNNIWFKKDLYHGEYLKDAPDILFSMGDYSYASSMRFAFASNKIFAPTLTFKSGEHNPNGILIVNGPLTKVERGRKTINLIDLTATILNLFGCKYENMDSKSKINLIFKVSKVSKILQKKEERIREDGLIGNINI